MNRRRRRGPVAWDQIRERLARTDAEATARAESRTAALVAERTRRLATRPADAPSADALEAVTFTLAADRFAVETRVVREIVRLADLTPVPGVPPFIVGVTNYRGQVLCVVDLRKLLDPAAPGVTDQAVLIVFGTTAAEFAVLGDRATDIIALTRDQLLPPAAPLPATSRPWLLGVTRDATMVLDGDALLQEPRLFVGDSHVGHDDRG